MVIAFALKHMVPCLIDHGLAHVIVVAQKPGVVFIVFAIISFVVLMIFCLSQVSVSPVVTQTAYIPFDSWHTKDPYYMISRSELCQGALTKGPGLSLVRRFGFDCCLFF